MFRFVFSVLLLCGCAHVSDAADLDAEDWVLVWQDEFDVDGLPSLANWDYEEGYLRNDEDQYYTRGRSENARVENGVLVLEARKDGWEGHDYTSASLTTRRRAAWTYGYIEIRAQIPAGTGLWPALWTLGDNIGIVGWPQCGEIDIMENVGFQGETIHTNIHTKAYTHENGQGKGSSRTIEGATSGFHTYAIDWDADVIRFIIDGVQVWEYANEGTGDDVWPYDKAQYLIMNIAVGGSWGGEEGIDDSVFPAQMLVDYVRVYQRKEAGPYLLEVDSSDGGQVIIEGEQASYKDGSSVRLQADPDVGWLFSRWAGVQAERSSDLELEVNRNVQLKALFSKAGQQVSNDGFEEGLKHWYFWASDEGSAEVAVDTGALNVVVDVASSEAWEVQAGQSGLNLKQGQRYRFSFRAWSEGAMSVIAKLAHAESPYPALYTQEVETGADEQVYEYEFVYAGEDDDKVRVEFDFGDQVGTLHLDDVSLISMDDLGLTEYQTWQVAHRIRPLDHWSDDDGDGWPLIYEYVMGMDPSVGDFSGRLGQLLRTADTISLEPVDGLLVGEEYGVLWRQQRSGDLSNWVDSDGDVNVSEAPFFLRARLEPLDFVK